MKSEFILSLRTERNCSPKTQRAYTQRIDVLEAFTGKVIQDVTQADLRAYLRESAERYSSSTRALTINAAKAFHRWGAECEFWSLNGIMAIRGPRVVHGPGAEPLDVPSARTVMAAADTPALARLVFLGLWAGLRVHESALVSEREWRDPHVLDFVGKGSKRRQVPVRLELASVRDLVLSRTYCSHHLTIQCAALSRRLGFKFTSHSFRKTFAKQLREGRVSREVIGSLLGHGSTVTEVYAPVADWEKVEAMARLAY